MSESERPQQLVSTILAPDEGTPHGGAEPDATFEVGVGQQVGRYVILSKLGAGGMGVVYAAYDPELDRKVAIKLLRPGKAKAGGGDDAKARLLREAQAMAQLSHPNVIAVFDVGTLEDQVFFAMEFVAGLTLRQWQAARTRRWSEALTVYRAAGRGLAAAHEVGLHHRDFKPDNVLVGSDGRVRVLDFGLARAGEDGAVVAQTRTGAVRALQASERMDGSDDGTATTRLLSQQLTRDGAVLGTPAYMAPEQHLGAKTDARTDQFSFCVALYEALYGERPFAGDSLARTALAVIDGDIRAEPKGSKVPAWLRRALLRGLAPKPEDRWPDMAALLEVLDRDPNRRRVSYIAVALVGALALGGGYGVWQYQQGAAELCADVEDPLASVWDAERKAAAEAAFLATGESYAADVWSRVATTLDRYTGEYVEQRRDACEAAIVRREQSMDLMQRRYQCLGRRLKEVKALSDLFLRADARVVQKAAQAASSLAPLSHCADTDALMTSLDPPLEGEIADGVKAVDVDLARIKAMRKLGQPKEAREVAEAVVGRADELGHRPSQARARYELGVLLRDAGEAEPARAMLLAAARMAERAHDDLEAAAALATVVYVIGRDLNRPEEAMEWADYADASLERVGGDLRIRADLESGIGSVQFHVGKMAEARGHFEKALAMRRALRPEDPERVAASLNNLASVAFTERKVDEALARFEELLAVREEQLGARHPELASLIQNVGAALTRKLEFERALVHFERAASIQREAFGEDHPLYAAMLANMGVVLERLGRFDEAEKAQRDALAIRRRIFGPEHDSVAGAQANLGSVLAAQGRDDEALVELERAVAIFRATLGPEHYRLANALMSEADLRLTVGDLGRARTLFEEAAAMRTKLHGEEDVRTVVSRGWVAVMDLERSTSKGARERLERAVESLPEDEESGAGLRFRLAKVWWEAGEESRARRLAERALEQFERAAARREAEAAETWLAKRR